MPRMQRMIGCLKYDPHDARIYLTEPTAPGSRNNQFLKKLRQEIAKGKIFDPCPKDIYSIFGTDKHGMRRLWREASSKEVNARLTEAQKAGLAKGQAMARSGQLKPPKLSGVQRKNLTEQKKASSKLKHLQAGLKRSREAKIKKSSANQSHMTKSCSKIPKLF
jgi:hypothetical protein